MVPLRDAELPDGAGDTLRSERGIRLARLARLPVRFRPVTVFSGAGG